MTTLSAQPSAAEIRTLLARAYRDDPLMAWVFPDEGQRLHGSAAWLGVAVERFLAGGRLESAIEDGALTAVVLWLPPGTRLPGGDDVLPSAGGLLQAVVGPAWAAEVAEGFAAARKAAPAPAEPHAYINYLAVTPGSQGRRLGGELLERVLAHAAEQDVPLRLETTNPVNLPFYEGHGLRVRSEVPLGTSGPAMWALET